MQIQLRQEDARLTYLAIAYHLGRPGSELDPVTKRPVAHGLAEVAQTLQPQLRTATATVSLDADQLNRLLSGMLGSITELKAYPMLAPRSDGEGGGRRSAVAGFDSSLRHLFPEVEEDVETALEVAERMLLLKRELDSKVAATQTEAPAEPAKKRGWWPFRR